MGHLRGGLGPVGGALLSLLLSGVLGAALAATPVLGPGGWTWLGPFPPGSDPRDEGEPARDAVGFDPADCSVDVERVDLDAGPGHRDVRLARVWTGETWAWADDWRVRDGRLVRPGRAEVPATGFADGWGYEADAEGRVGRRWRGARRVEVVYDGDRFVGMRDGVAEVRIEAGGARGVAWDGRLVQYRWRNGWLEGVTDGFGVPTTYVRGPDGLLGVGWADGGAVRFARDAAGVRIEGAGGAWRCAEVAGGREVTAPGGARWQLRGDEIIDPSGLTLRITADGWYDPRGGTTRVERDAAGRVRAVTGPDGVAWRVDRDATGRLLGLVGPGGSWLVGRDALGRVFQLVDPSGRVTGITRDPGGGLRGVSRGVGARGFEVGRDGLLERVLDPGGGEVRLARDPVGRVERVVDPAGATWTLERGPAGWVTGVVDPVGGRWSLARDRMGRVAGVVDPAGRSVEWSRRVDGRLDVVTVDGRARWELVRSVSGHLTSLRDPLARRWSFTRDLAGRVFRVARPDGSVWSVPRDRGGEIAGIDGVRVERGLTGRPRRAEVPGQGERVWTWDAHGRLVGVRAPGVALTFARDAAGALAGVTVGSAAPTRLERDGAGRVVAAGEGRALVLSRDAAGRVSGWKDTRGMVTLGRDLRGLVTQVRWGDRLWTLRRDAVGRVLAVEAPDGLRVGVDRDGAGRAVLARFSTGELARLAWRLDGGDVVVADRVGAPMAARTWGFDRLGRLARLGPPADPLVLARDPLGVLVAVEGRESAWSVAPGRIEGPGVAWETDPTGRAMAGRLPEAAWGLAGEVRQELGPDGALAAVVGSARVALTHDAAGRLSAWGTPGAETRVERDPLGRIAAVAGKAVLGWEGLLSFGGAARASLPEACAGPEGGVLLDPRGTPLFTLFAPGATVTPSGLPLGGGAGPCGAGGSFQPVPGGPLFGRVEAVDPLTGQPTAAPAGWPWAGARWEARVDASPFPDPDRAGPAPWDPAALAPAVDWGDPLALLVAGGALESLADELGGELAPVVEPMGPGVPWLPASLAPVPPAPLPDPERLVRAEEPLVRWVLAHATPPVRPAEPRSLAAFLLREELRRELALGPPALRDGADELLDAMGL